MMSQTDPKLPPRDEKSPPAKANEFPRAVIYLRVSTKEQAETGGEAEGFSIPAQRAACKRKADSLGAVVEEEFVDRGESAKTANRPELAKMLRYLGETPVNYVIVHKVDRLARNRADDVVITMEIKKSGAALVSCSENIDETPSGLLLHGIMSSIAEFYSQNLATEVNKGLIQKAETGGTVFKAPIGYRHVRTMENGREKRTVEIDPERAPLVKWVFEAYATGEWTFAQLLDELADRGLVSRGGPKTPPKPVSLNGLHKILNNPYYTGVLAYRGVVHAGNHEPLVSQELFDRVKAVLTAHNHAGDRHYRHNHYLKGSVYCGTCGSRLAVTYSRSHTGKIYDYFFCLGRQHYPGSCEQSVVRVHRVERLVADNYRSVALPPEEVEEIGRQLQESLSSRRKEAEVAEQQLDLRIQRLTDERKKLLRLHYADAVPIELFKSEQERITRELENARKRLAAVSLAFDEIEQNMRRALELARDCHRAYVEAPENQRRHFNQAFFEKIYVRDDGEIRHELAEPFRILLDPDLRRKLRSLQEKAQPGGSLDEDGRAQSAAVGSNVDLMVEAAGLEPASTEALAESLQA